MSLPNHREVAPAVSPELAADALPSVPAHAEAFVRFFGKEDRSNSILAELFSIGERLAPRTGKAAPAITMAPARPLPARNPLGPPISPETIVARVGTLASLPNIYFQVDK